MKIYIPLLIAAIAFIVWCGKHPSETKQDKPKPKPIGRQQYEVVDTYQSHVHAGSYILTIRGAVLKSVKTHKVCDVRLTDAGYAVMKQAQGKVVSVNLDYYTYYPCGCE